MKTFKPLNLYKIFNNFKYESHLFKELDLKINEFNDEITDIKTIMAYNQKILEMVIYPVLSKNSAIGTSTLEGINTTIDGIDLISLKDKTSTSEEYNNLMGSRIYERLSKRHDFNFNLVELSKEIHHEVFEGIKKYKPAKFKTTNNFIVDYDNNPIIELIDHKFTESELNELSDFARDHNGKMHPVILASIIHAYFIAIHPFSDGNGRVGRIIMNEFLKHSYKAPLFLDEVLNLNKTTYVKVMNNFILDGEKDSLINFFLQSTIDQINRNINIIKDIKEQERVISSSLSNIDIKQNYKDLLISFAISTKFVSINSIANVLGIDRRTATSIIEKLISNNLIAIFSKSHKNKIYKFNI